LQFYSQKQAEQQQAQQGAPEGAEGAPEGAGGAADEGAPEEPQGPPEGEEALTPGEGDEPDENGELPLMRSRSVDRSLDVLRKGIRRRVENGRVVLEFDLPR
jgi:hypothetical protein